MRSILRSRLAAACTAAVATAAVAVGGSAVAATSGGHRSKSPLTKKEQKAVNAMIAAYVKKHPGPRGPAGGPGAAGAAGSPGPAGANGVAQVQEAFGSWQWADSGNRFSVAVCPAGTVPTGGGVEVDYWSSATSRSLPNDGNIVIAYSQSNDSNGDGRPDGWTAMAVQRTGTTPPSGYRPEVTAIAVCAPGGALPRASTPTAAGAAVARDRAPARATAARQR